MRLSSFLPTLLLWCCSALALYAQNNCNIFDLTAVAGPVDPATCKYEVKINFGHTGTSNQFKVSVGGQSFGPYTYGNLPIVVGPFTAGAIPALKNVVVADAAFQDCVEEVTLTTPTCLASGNCQIGNILLSPGDCVPGSTIYPVKLNFDVLNPGNDFFEVWTGSGQYLGAFPLNTLPIQLPFPWGGGAVDKMKICIKGNPDCCKVVEWDAPSCLFNCTIKDFTAEVGECTSDSTYKVKINFTVDNPQAVSKFKVWSLGGFIGEYSTAQLPLLIPDFPWDGGPIDVIKVCLTEHPNCCAVEEIKAPDCLPDFDCLIYGLKVETDSCTSDSTFGVWINFKTILATVLDSFDIYGNGQYLGTFAQNQLPIHIAKFPWNGLAINFVKVCVKVPGTTITCCKSRQFVAPDCLKFGDCKIKDIVVKTGPCTSNTSYKLTVNFQATNPLNGKFGLWGNGVFIGIFNLSDLPLSLPNFKTDGGAFDEIKICIDPTSSAQPCCESKEFPVPDCLNDDCKIYDLNVTVGDCNPGGDTYKLKIDFQVTNPSDDQFDVFGLNGQLIGTFNLNQLPILVDYPCTQTNTGLHVVKICINDNGNCCLGKEFHPPACCSNGQPCEIYDLVAVPGDCIPGSTKFKLKIDFQVENPTSDQFEVYSGNGTLIGVFNLNQLPITLEFPCNPTASGFQAVKVCIKGNQNCCRVKEFQAPSCCINTNPCEIYDLVAVAGDCIPGTTKFKLKVEFKVENPTSDQFEVYAGNGTLIGTFNLNQLPITLEFPCIPTSSGLQAVKVCIKGNQNCCRVKEFQAPSCCVNTNPCKIYDLVATPGDCIPGTDKYKLKIDFEVDNPTDDQFDVFGPNGALLGTFKLSDLPVLVEYPCSSAAFHGVKVCINDDPNCCKGVEYPAPACCGGSVCEIYDLKVETGDCNSDSTYKAWVTFKVENPPSGTFQLWANGQLLGNYNLTQLPVYIEHFPWNGGAFDVVKVCMVANTPNQTPCCRTIEFPVPDCLKDDCQIKDLKVETGDCTSDSTYNVWINFTAINPTSTQFGVWANGELIGIFNLNQLPLHIEKFPWDGGNFDFVKVCIAANTGSILCCAVKEFEVPDCLKDPCKIYDLHVVKTPCLCGQFFALVQFKHLNGGNGGFDIMGNGQNYGNWPYNTPQPIILGPFPGDGTTEYEFVVKDHNHPNECKDDFVLGKVLCNTPAVEPGSGSLVLSPNPANEWLNVTAVLNSGKPAGQATVQVYQPDGKLVLTETFVNGSNFSLDISLLPAGLYRLSLVTELGVLEGVFAKQ